MGGAGGTTQARSCRRRLKRLVRNLAITCALAGVALAAAWWWSGDAGSARRSRAAEILRDSPEPESLEPAVRSEGQTTEEACRVEVVLTGTHTHASIDGTRRIYRVTPETEFLLGTARKWRPLAFEVDRGEKLVIRAEASGYEPGAEFELRLDPNEAERQVRIPLRPYIDASARLEIRVRGEGNAPFDRFQLLYGPIDGDFGAPSQARRIGEMRYGMRLELTSDRYWFRVSAPSDKLADGTRIPNYWMPQVFEIHLPGNADLVHEVILRKGARVRVTTQARGLIVRSRSTKRKERRRVARQALRGIPRSEAPDWVLVSETSCVATLPQGEHLLELHQDQFAHRLPEFVPLSFRTIRVRAGESLAIDLSQTPKDR